MRVSERVSVQSLPVSNPSRYLDQGLRESDTSASRAPGRVRHEGRSTIGIAITHAPNAITQRRVQEP